MARRIIGIVLTLLGAAAIVLGVLSTTAWRTSDTVTAVSPEADVPFVVIEPGVAGVNAPEVEVVITAADPDQQVTLITGRDVDVDGWLGDAAQQRITNVVDWETMVTQDVEGVTTDLPSPVGNDMWLETQQADGELAFSYEVPTTGRQTLLVVRDAADGPAPTVSFTWTREVTTPYFLPLLTGGIAGVVVGLALIVWSFVSRRRRAADAETETNKDSAATSGTTPGTSEDDAATATPDEAATAGEPSDPPTAETAVLTRRQLRALAESGAGGAAGAVAYEGLRERIAAVDVERIASEIAPADEEGRAPDDPDAYPDWLRRQEGEAEESDAADVEPQRRPTWGERWGVAAVAEAEPAEAESAEVESDEAEPAESEPAESEQAESEPAESEQAEPDTDAAPTDTAPVTDQPEEDR